MNGDILNGQPQFCDADRCKADQRAALQWPKLFDFYFYLWHLTLSRMTVVLWGVVILSPVRLRSGGRAGRARSWAAEGRAYRPIAAARPPSRRRARLSRTTDVR